MALADLITSLEEAKAVGRLGHRLKTLTYPSLLVVDEIGYLPVSQTGAMLFFQLITSATSTHPPGPRPTRASRSGEKTTN